MEEKYEKNNKYELKRLFELAWMNFYQAPEEHYTLERYQYIYESLQMLILRESEKKAKDSPENIMLLKLLQKMYDEIVLKQLKSKAQEKGLTSLEAKEQLYEKIFGEKLRAEDENAIKKPEKIPEIYQENILKEKERKNSDFEELYNPQLIKSTKNGDKDVEFYANPEGKEVDERDGDTFITIKPIGVLRYTNAFGLQSHINKYSVVLSRKKDGKYEVSTNNIYSSIDINKFTRDEEYKKAVVEKLLSPENMEKQKNEGYIGEIARKQNEPDYELFYSSEEYSAIRAYNEQRERKIQEILEENKQEER